MRLIIRHFALTCLIAVYVSAADTAPKPNVILIMADDMGYSDLACYGGEIETPNIDRLAANGLRFTNFYNEGRCWPTRAALLTGRNAHDVGHAMQYGPDAPRAYQGTTPERGAVLSELIGTAGYHSYHSGKWHLASSKMGSKEKNEATWAINRGFDRSYTGVTYINFFNPEELRIEGKSVIRIGDTDPDFYITDILTERALLYLNEHEKSHPDTPFFLYLAHLAPHYPLHAKPEDIAKYRGKYKIGWDVMRKRRHERLRELGIFEGELSERDPSVPAWDSLSDKAKDKWEKRMAVHAAMVDCIDQGIGRIMDWLEKTGKLDNTLILFLSDNGASREAGGGKRKKYNDPKAPIGSSGSFSAIETGWSNACNTPYRLHKSFNHEGGIATPLIVHWPNGIAKEHWGTLTHQVGHVIDVVPTVLELTGLEVPEEITGQSLIPVFDNPDAVRKRTLFWEHLGNRAVRKGDWKLVAVNRGPWELYNLKTDPVEMHNLKKERPEKMKELQDLWNKWAGKVGYVPRK